MSEFIITYTPCFKKNMVRELLTIDRKVEIRKVFSDSQLLISSGLEYSDFIKQMENASPIFVKHLMPVMETGTITEDLATDQEAILERIKMIVPNEINDFTVQCRIVGGGKNGLSFSSKDIEVFVGSFYELQGNNPVFSDSILKNDDVNVISIFINKNDYYLGFSTSKENLNFHCDEYRVCSKKGREISRAENKLKEALTKFNIQLTGTGYALDIGAAPGGWTKVLADHGYNVIAVDPGELKKELLCNPKIKHLKCRIEDLQFDNFFDIIVNDMNVTPQITARIMNDLSTSLKDNGLAIVTLKLPDKVEEDICASVGILEEKYDVLTIKSLFHNRQEVTALVQRKAIVKEQKSSPKVLELKK